MVNFDLFDAVALVVWLILVAAAFIIIVLIGSLPGRIARMRGHPQATAVTAAEHIALTLGTSLLYIPKAAPAYPQLPLGIDPDRTIPGRSGTPAVRPLPPALTPIFLSTMTAGLEFRY